MNLKQLFFSLFAGTTFAQGSTLVEDDISSPPTVSCASEQQPKKSASAEEVNTSNKIFILTSAFQDFRLTKTRVINPPKLTLTETVFKRQADGLIKLTEAEFKGYTADGTINLNILRVLRAVSNSKEIVSKTREDRF